MVLHALCLLAAVRNVASYDGEALLRNATGLSREQWNLAMKALMQVRGKLTKRSYASTAAACGSPLQCLRELYARLHVALHYSEVLPLSRGPWTPWVRTKEHPHFGLPQPAVHGAPPDMELEVERHQIVDFFGQVRALLKTEAISVQPPPRKCLEWEFDFYVRTFLGDLCDIKDIVEYDADGSADNVFSRDPSTGAGQRWNVDIHRMIPPMDPNSFDIIVCTQVFEHIADPPRAMRQLYSVLRPLGMVVWSAPMFSIYHRNPVDYWRFTAEGARYLAEQAGFQVRLLYAPGNVGLLTGLLQGIHADYFLADEMLAEDPAGVFFNAQTYMLLQREA